MIRTLAAKIFRLILLLLAVTLMIFLLMHAVPGNPWSEINTPNRLLAGVDIDQDVSKKLSHRFGLDLPLWRQYTRFLIGDVDDNGQYFCGAVCGNFGPSIQQRGRLVQEILFQPPRGRGSWDTPFGYSLRLVFFTALLATLTGIPLGIISAAKPRSALSRAISVGLAAVMSIPSFVLGLLAIIVLASWLGVIKIIADWNQWTSWIVPTLVLAAMPMSGIARVTRATLMNTMSEDYVRTARAKGLTQRRVILKHVFRNALVPILTFLGPALLEIFTGLFVVEGLYSFPGLGREYWKAAVALDIPMILALTVIYAAAFALVSALVETLSALLDPRIRSARYQEARS